MTEPLAIEAGELREDELIDHLKEGRRIVVSTTFLGSEQTVTLRFDGETFYCDTPTRLHRHDQESEMRSCVANNGYTKESRKAE